MKYSIIVVSLNAGEDLLRTVESVLSQSYRNTEVIVKDGCSTDGSINLLPEDNRIRIVSQKDKGIYDAMNQAMDIATGDFILFMNCGDLFFNDNVLQDCADHMKALQGEKAIFYGDCYTMNRNSVLKYPDFTDYLCFTMVLCHQATFYPVRLIKERKFCLDYKIAADYEYYVHAYKSGVLLIHLPITVAVYQGNGASETTKNRRLALNERKRILKENYRPEEYRRVWIHTRIRGVGIKQFLVCQEWFYPAYKKIAELYYKRNKTEN